MNQQVNSSENPKFYCLVLYQITEFFLYVHDSLNGILPKPLNNNFVYIKDGHNYNKDLVSLPSSST